MSTLFYFQDFPEAHDVVKSALSSQLETVDDVIGQEFATVELGELEFCLGILLPLLFTLIM